jgi:hypothetical protein
VIFDNGSLIGPDSGPETLKDNFLAYVQAKQSVYRTILERIDHGMRGDEAFQSPCRNARCTLSWLGRRLGPCVTNTVMTKSRSSSVKRFSVNHL